MVKKTTRQQGSRDLLFLGLCRLLKAHRLNDISVSALCQEAKVGRTTFYRYYHILADIIIERYRQEINALMAACHGKQPLATQIYQVFLESCRFCAKYPNLVYANYSAPMLMNVVLQSKLQDTAINFDRKVSYPAKVFLAGA